MQTNQDWLMRFLFYGKRKATQKKRARRFCFSIKPSHLAQSIANLWKLLRIARQMPPPPLLISNLTTLMNGFASVEFLGIHGHITWYKYLLILQTEATSHVGGRFHQLFGSNLVEPAEEDLLNELSGHLHYGFQTQSTSENRVNFRL